MHATASVEDYLWELGSLFYHVGSKDLTQVFGLGGKHLYPLNYLAGP